MKKIKKVLLIQVPFKHQETVFPLGLAYIAGFIKQKGYEVAVIDGHTDRVSKEEMLGRIRTVDFDIVGISAMANRYQYVAWLSQEIKRIRDVPIVVGNGLGTGSYNVLLETIPEVDFCVIGEGEETFLDILERGYTGRQDILGVAYRENGSIKVNPKRLPRLDINLLPWPAYELFDMEKYTRESSDFLDTGYFTVRGNRNLRRKIFFTITARGCPYQCKFCGKIIEKVRLRDINDIVKEIRFLKENYGVTGIVFYDELFIVNKARTIALAQELKKLGILWSCQGRVNMVDLELLKTMKECGCVVIGYGIESGSQKLLDAMHKQAKVAQILGSMKCAKEAGITVKVQLIFGYTGEDRQSVRDTINLFKELKDPGRRFNIIRPLPGSPLYDDLIRQGIIDNEVEYLKNIEAAGDNNLPIVNMTAFSNDELKLMTCRVEGVMLWNYIIFMMARHPIALIRDFIKYQRAFYTVLKFSIKLLLTYNKPLFNLVFKTKYPPGYKIYSKNANN